MTSPIVYDINLEFS